MRQLGKGREAVPSSQILVPSRRIWTSGPDDLRVRQLGTGQRQL